MRATHTKQQQIVNKLVHFLVTLVQPKRLGKRHLLAIDEASSPKKTRMNNGDQSNALQVIQSNNVNDILDNLIRDFSSRNYDQNMKNENNSGPIISDVTDELDHLTTSGRLHNDFILPSDGQMNYPQSNIPIQQRQPPQQRAPVYRVCHDLISYLSNTGRIFQDQMQVPPVQVQNMPPPDMNLPMNNMPIQDPSLPLANPVDEPFVLSPNGQLPFTPNDFADYLNGVDQGIDSCRDLIGDQWNNFDFESLLDGSGESPEEHYQQPLSLEQTHPVYNYSPTNMNRSITPTTNKSSPGNRTIMIPQQQLPTIQQGQRQNLPSPNNYQQLPPPQHTRNIKRR